MTKEAATTDRRPTQRGYYIYVTEACNLRCNYCFVSDKSNQRHLTDQMAERVLAHIAADAAQCGSIYVHFFGGEPLIRPRMVDYLAGHLRSWSVAQGIRLRLGVTTNGTLLTPAVCEMLQSHDIGVQLSLDGSKQGHDVHRQLMGGTCSGLRPVGSFDMVQIDNYIRHFGGKQPNCRMTLTIHNLPYLGQSIEELHNRGFKNFSVIPDSDCGQWTSEHYSQYEKEMSRVFEYWSKHNDISVNTIEQTILKLVKKQESRNLCPVGRGIVGITVDGDIYPCHDLAGKFAADPAARAELILGNVCDGYLPGRREALDPVPVRDVLSGNGHNCSTCWARWACARGCPYMNYARAGDIRTANAVYCATMRINASLALQWMSALGQFRFVALNGNGAGKAVQRVMLANDGTATGSGKAGPPLLPVLSAVSAPYIPG